MQEFPDELLRVILVDEVDMIIPARLSKAGYRCSYFPGYRRTDYLREIHRYTGAIIRSKIAFDRELLDSATNLKFIGRVGSGMEGIDLEAAREKEIRCFNSPEGNRDAVGEHALGMLLALMNHMPRADRQIREGSWIREANRGTEIKGKTIGIIGYGNMGKAFARRLSGFEADVISYDKYLKGYGDAFTREVSLETLMDQADILSLHVPLSGETTGMVNREFMERFRKPFWLVNTSRGKVVSTDDLADALREGKVLGAALDVLEQEDGSFERLSKNPAPAFRYLLESEQVLLTPHVAGWTMESKPRLANVLVDKILEAESAWRKKH